MFVGQVNRGECEIILSSQWPEKNGNGRLFISLTAAAYAALPGDLASKGVAAKAGWWGYRTLIVTDPDGNELYFPRSRRQRRRSMSDWKLPWNASCLCGQVQMRSPRRP